MKDLSMKQWTEALASKDGKYGGGSAASVVGAFAVNLGQYVLELQSGKKKYTENEEDIQKAIEQAKVLSDELLGLAEIDADAFEPVLSLYQLPKDTEEQRIEHQDKIDQGLAEAARPPLDILKKMDEVLDIFEFMIQLEIKGSIVDDIAVGLIFTEATIESEKLNCDINTKPIKNAGLKKEMEDEVDGAYHRILERCRELKATAFKIIDHNV